MEKFYELLAEILEVEPKKLALETELKKTGTWNSLSIVSFMAMVDLEYDKQLEPEAIIDSQTVGDLYALIR